MGAEHIAALAEATARHTATGDRSWLFGPSVDAAVAELGGTTTSDPAFAVEMWHHLGRLFWHRGASGPDDPEEDRDDSRDVPEGDFTDPTSTAVGYLLNALLLCLRQYEDTGAPAWLVDGTADDIASMLAAVPSDSLDVAEVLGWFHWSRHRLAPGHDRHRADALHWFARIAATIPQAIRAQVLTRSTAECVAELVEHGQRSGDTTSFERAVVLCRQELASTGEDDELRPVLLGNLAAVLIAWVDSGDDDDDVGARIDLAVEAAAEAVRLAGDEHPSRHDCGRNLPAALLRRHSRFGRDADLDAAFDALDLAVHAGAVVLDLATAFERRHRRDGVADDLHRAIAAWRSLCASAPEEVEYRVRLIDALRRQADLEQAPAGLVEPVGIAREVLRDLLKDGAPAGPLLSVAEVLLTARAADEGLVDLDEAVHVLHRVIKVVAALQPHERGGEVLDSSVTVFRLAAPLVPDDHPSVNSAWANLLVALFTRYVLRGDEDDLAEVVRTAERYPDTPGTVVGRLNSFTHCTDKLLQREEFATSTAEIDALLRLTHLALRAAPDEAVAALLWSNATYALHARYELSGRREDLDDLIAAARAAAEGMPDDIPVEQRAAAHRNLSTWLLTRIEDHGVEDDLDPAVDALFRFPPTESDADPSLANHCSELAGRLTERGGPDDLRRAEECCRHGLAASPARHPVRIDLLLQGARAAYLLHGGTGDLSCLERSVALAEEAINAGEAARWRGTEWTESRARYLLATFLRMKAERTGEPADHDLAVRAARQAVAVGGKEEVMALTVLAHALVARFALGRRPVDLDEAMTAARHAVAIARHGHDPLLSRIALTSVLRQRGESCDDAAALQECVRTAREALRLAGPVRLPNVPLPERPLLTELSAALLLQYLRSGDVALLNESIEIRRQLLEWAGSAVERAKSWANLGRALSYRYVRIGRLSDLTDAMTALRRSIAAYPFDVPFTARNRSDLVSALHTCYLRVRDPALLDEAVDVGRRSIAATHDPDSQRALMMANLAQSLAMRYAHTGRVADLREAVDYGKRAVAAPTTDQVTTAQRLHDLGSIHQLGVQRSADRAHLSEAVTCFRAALAAIPEHHPFEAVIQHNLAHTLVGLHDSADADILEEAVNLFRKAAANEGSPVALRCGSAHAVGAVEGTRGNWSGAVAGFRTAVELLPRLVSRAQQRPDQEHHLAQLSTLPSASVAAALQAGDTGAAMVLLEGSRGVLLSHVLEARDSLAELRERHPDLAARLEEVRERLNQDDGRH